MLSSNELSNVQNLISDETKTFEELISKFITLFDSSKYFLICMALETLIKDHQLNIYQETAGLYILYHLNKEVKGYSNFSSFALNILNETKIKVKQIILLNFIKNNFVDLQTKIIDYIKFIEDNKNNEDIDNEIINLKNEGYTHENNNSKNFFLINPIIFNKKKYDYSPIKQNKIAKHILDKNNLKYIEPNYLSYFPFQSKEMIFKNEVKWILPSLKHNFIWENNCYDKIKYLLKQILDNGAITSEEINYIISSIKKKPNIIKNINLTPQLMMELIEKDESLSFEILTVVCKTSLNE